MLSSISLTAAFGLTAVLAVPTITSSSCVQGALIAGTTCVQECNTDRNGGDFGALAASSLQDCALACSQDPRCLTAQYSKGNSYCYLKSSLNAPNSNGNVDGVVCRQPTVTTTTAQSTPTSCPTDATYTASTGATFTYTCGLDYYGGDLQIVYSITSISSCLDACAATPSCIKVTWHQTQSVCYLKNGDTTERSAPGEWAGKLITSSTTTSSTTSSSSSTTTTSSTTTSSPSPTTTSSTTTTTSTTTTVSVAPFSCPTDGYMVTTQDSQPPALYSVNVATGQKTLIKAGLTSSTSSNINAMGYNSIDNKLYAVLSEGASTATIIQIDAQGNIVRERTVAATSNNYNVGDVDENGDFWISTSGTAWLQINIASMNILASGTASIPFGVFDWAFVPGGGNFLYGIVVDGTGSTFLYRFNRVTHTWAQVGTGYGVIYPSNGAVGAVYASQDGFLYGSENIGGKIYKFSLDGRTATFVATGLPATANDGAHCINNVATTR